MDTATSEYFTVYSSVVYDLQNVICSKFVDFLINSFYFTGIIFVMIFLEKNLCFMRSLRVIMIESLTYCWLTYTDVKLPIWVWIFYYEFSSFNKVVLLVLYSLFSNLLCIFMQKHLSLLVLLLSFSFSFFFSSLSPSPPPSPLSPLSPLSILFFLIELCLFLVNLCGSLAKHIAQVLIFLLRKRYWVGDTSFSVIILIWWG